MQIGGQLDSASGRCSTQAGFQRIFQQIRENQTQIGVPAEALSLVMGIDSLLGMFRTAVNSTGDVAVSLIVAKSEKLLDTEKYNS